jgi:hypothetical protein
MLTVLTWCPIEQGLYKALVIGLYSGDAHRKLSCTLLAKALGATVQRQSLSRVGMPAVFQVRSSALLRYLNGHTVPDRPHTVDTPPRGTPTA